MIWLLPILAAASDAEAAEPLWECDEPVVQQQMNYCAHQDYLAADRLLNEQWQKTVAKMRIRDEQWNDGHATPGDDRPGYYDTLLEAQRAWIKFRDAHCASEGYWFRGGTMEPLIISTCKTDLTEKRTEQLRQLESFE